MRQRHLNIVLANCPINNGNRGCVALSISVMAIIDELLSDKGVNYTFYLPQSEFREECKHSFKFGSKEIFYVSMVDPGIPSLKMTVKHIIKYKQYRSTTSKIKHADFILDIGQGDSFADIYGKQRFESIHNMYRLGHKYHIPYCILPQTIGPYKAENIRKAAVKSISRSKCVMTRDKQSYDYIKSILPSVKVSEIIDVAFFMPYMQKTFDSKHIHVGLNISALLWHGGYTRDNQFGLKEDYQAVIRSIIEYFLKVPNVKLHLVPHVVKGERSIENDYAVCYDLCEEYNNPNLMLAPLFLDPIAAKGYIAGMDFFMGGRMHSAIGAFSSGVPVIPMAYSRKFNGLFIDTLNYQYMVDLKTDTKNEILKTVEESFNNRNQLKNEIANAMNGVVKERKKLLYQELSIFLGI